MRGLTTFESNVKMNGSEKGKSHKFFFPANTDVDAMTDVVWERIQHDRQAKKGKQMIDDYRELLAVEGYRPQVAGDGEALRFKHDGEAFFLENEDKDSRYVRLRIIYTLPDLADEVAMLRIANKTNERMKAVKVSLDVAENAVSFSIEAFYSESSHFAPHLGRALQALEGTSDHFFKLAAESSNAEDG